MALAANMDNLALYCEPHLGGKMVVVGLAELDIKNVLPTGITNADGLAWCGNDSIALTFGKNLFLCGPEKTKKIEFPAATDGIFLLTEVDGLRIITPSDCHFMDIVSQELLDTF